MPAGRRGDGARGGRPPRLDDDLEHHPIDPGMPLDAQREMDHLAPRPAMAPTETDPINRPARRRPQPAPRPPPPPTSAPLPQPHRHSRRPHAGIPYAPDETTEVDEPAPVDIRRRPLLAPVRLDNRRPLAAGRRSNGNGNGIVSGFCCAAGRVSWTAWLPDARWFSGRRAPRSSGVRVCVVPALGWSPRLQPGNAPARESFFGVAAPPVAAQSGRRRAFPDERKKHDC